MSYQQPPGHGQQVGFGQAPPAAPPKKSKRNVWIAVVVGTVAFLVFTRIMAGRQEAHCADAMTKVHDAMKQQAYDDARRELGAAGDVCKSLRQSEREDLTRLINKAQGIEPQPASTARAQLSATATATPVKAKESDLPTGVYRTKGGHVAAVTKEKLDKAIQLVASGDEKAFARYLETEPGVIVLKEGVEVVLVDSGGILGSTVKVRPRGELVELWTVREALDIR